MGNILKGIGFTILGILLILGFYEGGLWFYAHYAPRYQAVQREVWENTPSRIQGAVQDIARRRIEYNKATDTVDKTAICQMLRDEYANLDPKDVDDTTLRTFFEKCKYGG